MQKWPVEQTDVVAFSIPYTKRHIRFTEETEAALRVAGIPFRSHVRIEYEDQYSTLDFYVAPADEERAAAVVQLTSAKAIPRASLGLPE